MKWFKYITECKCCANSFGVEWKHGGAYLDVRNLLNTALGLEVESFQRSSKLNSKYQYTVRRRLALHLLWFTVRCNFTTLEKMWERGVFNGCPTGCGRAAVVLTAEARSLNSRYCVYIDLEFPFLPSLDGGWHWGEPEEW